MVSLLEHLILLDSHDDSLARQLGWFSVVAVRGDELFLGFDTTDQCLENLITPRYLVQKSRIEYHKHLLP